MGKLDGRVAIVTGGAQGIGRAIVDKLAAEGARIVIGDIAAAEAEAAAAAVGGRAIATDIAEPDQVRNLVDSTVAELGKVDILVNNAAIVPFTPWDEIDFEEWRRIMRVNLDGTFLVCRAVSDAMRQREYGRIVSIVSNSILAGTPNLAHYEASKGGVFALTRALATELGKYGITVNSVAPGLTSNENTDKSPHANAYDFVQMLQAIPRRGVSADIAPAVAFLASEEAAWVTGQMLVVDAGHGALVGRGPMAIFEVSRLGTILAVADVDRSVAFYTERLGFAVDALYDDPPYATLTREGVRLSLAEQGHASPDRPGVTMVVPDDPTRQPVVLVLEVSDAQAIHAALVAEGTPLLAEPYAPPWGGLRFFVVDPDGYLVEIEQPA